MLIDPKKAMLVSLLVALGPLFWLIACLMGEAEIAGLVGDAGPPITFLSIFIFLASVVAALLFHRLAAIKDELLTGSGVTAHWRVGRELFSRFAYVAGARDRSEKRGALYVVLGFVLVIFGAFAVYDPEVAPVMLGIGAGVGLIMVLAYLLGQNATAEHLKFRTGDIIVGERGLLRDGVLHAWDMPLSWLSDSHLESDILVVTYAYYSRSGSQYVTVLLPVSEEARDAAAKANEGLIRKIKKK